MKIVSKDHLFQLDTAEHPLYKIIIENKAYYRDLIYKLYLLQKGEQSIFYLFADDKELSFTKKIHLILQPTFVELSDKKSKNKIASQLQTAITTSTEEDAFSELLVELNCLANTVISKSDFRLTYRHDLTIADIINLFDFRLDSTSGSFVENLLEYMLAIRTLENIDHFMILNLEDYLTETELKLFYENILQENLYLIDIESRYNSKISDEKLLVIDQDLCVFEG